MSLAYLQQESTPAHPDSIWALSWTSSNRLISGCADGHLRIYDPLDLSLPTHDVPALPLAVSSLSTTSDGSWALATSLDGTVVLVDTVKGVERAKVETGREKVGQGKGELPGFSAAIHPSGACWAWSGRSSKLAIRPISQLPAPSEAEDDGAPVDTGALKGDGKVVETGKGKFGLDVKFSPDGRQIALTTESGHVVIVDTETQTVISDYASHAMASRTAAWSADSQWLFTGSDDNRIVLHDVRAGSGSGAAAGAGSGGKGEGAVAILQGHQGWVLKVDASPDGRLVGSGGADSLVKLWDIGQRTCVSTTQADAEVWGLAWQPEAAANSVPSGPGVGKQFAIAGDDKAVTLFRAAGSV